jgi:signal transduction histidine kinase/CheY-like chemotaxis protein
MAKLKRNTPSAEMIYYRILCFFLALVLVSPVASASDSKAQHSNDGLPFYSVYNMDSLGKGAMSVYLSEDSVGRILAIDGGTLMVFDGNTWAIRSNSRASDNDSYICAAKGRDGVLYSGAVGRCGYLSMQPSGDFAFKSFDFKNAPEWTSAAHFEYILTTGKGVFFGSSLGIAFHGTNGNGNHYWNALLPPVLLFEYKGVDYASIGSGGLYRLNGWEWEVFPGAERYVGNEAFTKMAERQDGKAVLATDSGQLFIFDGESLQPWQTDADALLSFGIVDMIAMPSSELAIAVRGYGLVVIGADGRIKMRMDSSHDASFAGIIRLFQQENGILWASMPGGVVKIYYPAQTSFYDYRFGFSMRWPEVYHFKDRILIYSDYRLYLSSYDKYGCLGKFNEMRIFKEGLVESCLGVGDEMLYGISGTIYSYDGKSPPVSVVSNFSSARMRMVKGRPDDVMAFGGDMHALLHRENGKWKVTQIVPSVGFPAVVLQTSGGEMWLEHGLGRVSRIVLQNGKLVEQNFEKIEGMANDWVNVSEINGSVYLSSGGVIKRYDSKTGKLVDAPEMVALMNQIGAKVSRLYQTGDGTIWASEMDGVFLVRKVDGKYVVDRETLRQVSESHALLSFDDDGVVWILSRNKITRFNGSMVKPSYKTLKPVISSASSIATRNGETDTIIFSNDPEHPTVLPYAKNNISIRLFPNTYSQPAPPSYRYRLEGLNEAWSMPVSEPMIAFSNLAEGYYRLDIEVLDQGVSVGAVTSVAFRIEPPWTRTWWAYLIYSFFFVGVILIIVRFSQRHSERERRRLESLVAVRTHELDDTNTRLRESIKSAMAAAEAKSRFLANMSHEIRTPMNGVVGTTELLARTPLNSEQRELVEIINKSGSLLLSIVNDVLDYSKIEADQLVFELIPLRPQTLLEDVLEILGEKANEKRVEFFGSIESGVPYELIGDTTRVQQVIVNLCSNALKFTDHGEVEIKGWANERQDGRWDLCFSVRDTGIGMDPKRMDRLFKAFSQLDASNTRVYGGTGLGLAISKRLVERMGGNMVVTSEVGKGSCFQFSIPFQVSEHSQTPEGSPVTDCRLLLVDDCAARRGMTARFLSGKGFAVTDTSSVDAVRFMDNGGKFNMVVADCAVDSDSWREVAEAVSRNLKRVPLIVYRLPLQPVEHPAIVRRLTKPWRCSRLLAELRSCIDTGGEKQSDISVQSDSVEEIEASSLKVLLAEDNAVNQRVAVLLLSRLGIKPDVANNGQEAVDLVHEKHYDIVLMDVQMPIMDGIQATLAIRGSLKHEEQPIIVALTAGAMSSDREAAFNAGVDGYLTKPLRLETLREQINNLVEKVQMRRAALARAQGA